MRRKAILFTVANVVVIGFLVHLFWPLICLLFLTGEGDRISRTEIEAASGDQLQLIPKIIHQTWITCHVPDLLSGICTTKPIPDKWKEAYTSVKTIHRDYEYKLWTDQNSRDFIKQEYPWFLPTWDTYSYPIQRADAIRYFALYHYGGIYVDLDDGSQHRLDPLLVYRAWVRRTTPTGIGNDVIGAIPHHPFIEKTMKTLPSSNIHWPTPYITIMGSTGPLFFSVMWRNYNTLKHSDEGRIRLLFPEEYMGTEWSFFVHNEGNSWHQWDAELMYWMASHWIELTILGFAVFIVLLFSLWSLSNYISRKRRLSSQWRYTSIKDMENME